MEPFPIPRDIAFLWYQSNQFRESRLYGSRLLLDTMARYALDTQPYRDVLARELVVRRALIHRMARLAEAPDAIDKSRRFKYDVPQWKRAYRTPSMLNGPTLAAPVDVSQYASPRQLSQMLEYLVRNDDFVLNCNNLGKCRMCVSL